VLNTYFLQGSAAAYLRRGVSFNSTFLHKSFLDLIVTNRGAGRVSGQGGQNLTNTKIGPLLLKLSNKKLS